LQRETELVGVAAAALYGGEIGGTQGPVPDQFSFVAGKASSTSSCSRVTARRLGMANCPK
jgi:hypothetical protein